LKHEKVFKCYYTITTCDKMGIDVSEVENKTSAPQTYENIQTGEPENLDETGEVERHEFEGDPFEPRIPDLGGKGADGYQEFSSQVDRDRAEALQFLPTSGKGKAGELEYKVESIGKDRLYDEICEQNHTLDMETVDNSALNYLAAFPDKAFSPIQIAEEITPRDSFLTKEAAQNASDEIWNDEITEETREAMRNYNSEELEGYDIDHPEFDKDLLFDEEVEILAEEDPEVLNEIAIQYVAEEIRGEMGAYEESPVLDNVDSFDREVLEDQGLIDEEVRGDTFYKVSDEYISN
jgi:hypothetical protein